MQVIITPEAQKQLKKLPHEAQAKVRRKLYLLEENTLMGKKLEGELGNFRSIRAWPYRIIYMNEAEINQILSTFKLLP